MPLNHSLATGQAIAVRPWNNHMQISSKPFPDDIRPGGADIRHLAGNGEEP